ncbi:hypothetical protein MANY_01300 [Mycolicibacterium anyangense]|uniref:Mce-associated membrane protein n=1 Tax=Mycolicibacterium anyangense TaxID=1431246 RepID=A0A6N4W357_9MYCO|nr:hypothetical protein [Mycolicibacterium anyangense]BBZ74793.1 hypothetical protein MANY_01300 [Mycolicibacterium anyangense]
MTTPTTGDDSAEDTAPADTAVAVEEPAETTPSRQPLKWVAALLLIAAIGGGAFAYTKYQQVSHELAQIRRSQADHDAAAKLARDYALKSLTYTFEDPDAFFKSVEDGVSQPLKDKYVNATDLLKSIMLQAQVSSSGEVLATDAVLQSDGTYRVVVSAHQTTRNLQNPTPKVSIILLRVTVAKSGDSWQVTDIGPETGSQQATEQQLPGAPPPPPPPGKPAPKG